MFVVAAASAACGARSAPAEEPDPASAVSVFSSRVIDEAVDATEPVTVVAAGEDVRVTFGLRGRPGISVVMDPASLDMRAVEPVVFPPRSASDAPPYLPVEPAFVPLRNGRSLAVWTEPKCGRVMVQRLGTGGSPQGRPVRVSPAGLEAFGSPRAASPDGRRAVVAFLALKGDRLVLAGAAVDAP